LDFLGLNAAFKRILSAKSGSKAESSLTYSEAAWSGFNSEKDCDSFHTIVYLILFSLFHAPGPLQQ
jgi:hypothetical protein